MTRLLLLDLDNTLYSEARGMDHDIDRRMVEYVAQYLKLSIEEAQAARYERARKYSTTLEWLTLEHGFSDPEAYFAAVHPEGEESRLEPDPELGRVLDAIPLPKAVLTNAPSEHAERVLARLGVADRFQAVYDIRFSGLRGKPHAQAYLRACESSGYTVEETLFVDDQPKYVRGFVDLGGRALLIDEADRFAGEGLSRIRSLGELVPLLAE
jgi:putative hydrolase of the HAD superfamily